ncbi:putative holin-like toxin [Paenibacillus aquistagni]|nr:putative holin-like toxin [Paenibacillus aquistagni]NMM55583.1 putative holin-like toxin [Paenibacillus aquistagni]
MKVKDAITIMLLFGTFILALITYINNNNKRK